MLNRLLFILIMAWLIQITKHITLNARPLDDIISGDLVLSNDNSTMLTAGFVMNVSHHLYQDKSDLSLDLSIDQSLPLSSFIQNELRPFFDLDDPESLFNDYYFTQTAVKCLSINYFKSQPTLYSLSYDRAFKIHMLDLLSQVGMASISKVVSNHAPKMLSNIGYENLAKAVSAIALVMCVANQHPKGQECLLSLFSMTRTLLMKTIGRIVDNEIVDLIEPLVLAKKSNFSNNLFKLSTSKVRFDSPETSLASQSLFLYGLKIIGTHYLNLSKKDKSEFKNAIIDEVNHKNRPKRQPN